MAAVPPPVRSEYCPNCGAARSSHFCPDCGQSSADPRRDFGAVLSELLGSFFAVDGRVWRSLVPLFFRPGALTRAWMDGRRAAFLTPLRLLLFFSILLFLVVQSRADTTGILLGGDGGGSIVKITRDGEEVAPAGETPGLGLELPDSWPFTWLQARAEAQEHKFSLLSEEEQAYLLARRALELMPVALLMLLPLLAIFLKLWWHGTGAYYLDHLVFLMHAYAFLCGLLVLLMLISPPPAVTALALLAGVPIFIHRGLRRVHGRGFWRTAGCTLAGGAVTFAAAMLVMMILLFYGLLTV